ncbi:hypothetical protein KCV04_g9131, partial [Aureobasidium melanogenum]
ITSTYGHSQLKTGHPVRSAIHKQLNGRLVLRWVTTWESLLLYVLYHFVRNLFKVSITRRMPWLVLVCTSVPLHLFFNSAIYSATSTYTYTASVVTDDFFDGQFWTLDGLVWESASISLPVTDPKEYIAWMSEVQAGKIDLDRLENKECVEAYATPWLANRANLIMATSSGKKNITTYNNNSLIVAWGGVYSNEQVGPYSYSAYTWLCSDSEYPSGPEAQCSDLVKYPGNFSVMAWVQDAQYPNGSTSGFTSTIQVEYCLSQKVPERCTVESSIAIWATMICLVAVKLCCLLWTLLVLEDEPMVVPGDCVASFLHRPDLTTLGACLWPADKFRKNSTWMGELRWDSDTMPWRAAVGSRQWTSCLLLSIATMVTVTILLGMGLRTSDSTSSDLFRMGFGDPNLRFSLSSTFGAGSNSALALICAVLLANTPQLLITFVYFTYNSVFTSMVMASEWSQFAFQRKPLRVSNPTGRQQSTYRLQLPYRYGVPLMLLIVTLHWLISQSIFVLRIKVLDFQGIEDTGSSLTTCGYSLTAVLTAIITGGFAIMILVAHGTLRRYKPGMTLVGSSTAAISAACHPMPTEDADASLGELQWGVVPLGHEDEVGHCTFSAGPVSFPVEGRLYS